MPSSSEKLLKSMHQSNQGTEEKYLQGETAVAPWPSVRACLPLPSMQEVWRYIILLKGYAGMFSDMGLACPMSLNHALEGIAPRVVTSRHKHTSISDVFGSFLRHISFRNKIAGKPRNSSLTFSRKNCSVFPLLYFNSCNSSLSHLLQPLLVPDTAKKLTSQPLKFFSPYVTNWSFQSMSQTEFTF